jgi:hypothetical protein
MRTHVARSKANTTQLSLSAFKTTTQLPDGCREKLRGWWPFVANQRGLLSKPSAPTE